MTYKVVLIVFSSLLSFACATAPSTEPHTADTLGKGVNQAKIAGGYTPQMSISYKRGISDDLDLGLLIEKQNFGLLYGLEGKWKLPSRSNSSLFAGIGTGTVDYLYIGPIYSTKNANSNFELAFNFRYNIFRINFNSIRDKEKAGDTLDDIFDAALGAINGYYQYLSLNITPTVWVNKKWGLSLAVSGIYFVDPASAFILNINAAAHMKF